MLSAENSVLVVVDIQGKLATLMHNKEQFFENTRRMIEGAKVIGLPIIWNEQLPGKLGPTISLIKESLQGHAPLVKSTFSCCGNPDFMEHLAETNRKQVLLTGMETHVCVYQTASDLIDSGYEVYLVVNAVSSRTAEDKQIAVDAMAQRGVKLSSVEMALFEMLRVAQGEDFKRVIKIVK